MQIPDDLPSGRRVRPLGLMASFILVCCGTFRQIDALDQDINQGSLVWGKLSGIGGHNKVEVRPISSPKAIP